MVPHAEATNLLCPHHKGAGSQSTMLSASSQLSLFALQVLEFTFTSWSSANPVTIISYHSILIFNTHYDPMIAYYDIVKTTFFTKFWLGLFFLIILFHQKKNISLLIVLFSFLFWGTVNTMNAIIWLLLLLFLIAIVSLFVCSII